MKSAHDGFPRNPQEERRNPPMKPRRGPARNASPRKQGARDGSDRIHAPKGRATGRWQLWASKTTRHLRRVTFRCVEVAHQLPRGTWQPRTSSTPFGMAFGSPSSKQIEAPKRPATRGGSLWPRHNSQRRRDSHRDAEGTEVFGLLYLFDGFQQGDRQRESKVRNGRWNRNGTPMPSIRERQRDGPCQPEATPRVPERPTPCALKRRPNRGSGSAPERSPVIGRLSRGPQSLR